MAPWFKRKRWGYGWTPAGWEGWLATLLMVFTAMGIADPELVQSYNALKRRYDGRLMEQYRAAKDDFITHVLRSVPD